MPPRKSTSSIPPTDNEAASPTTTAEAGAGGAGAQITEQQLRAQSDGVSVEVGVLSFFLLFQFYSKKKKK